jgi:hypothetical protein
MYGGYPAQDPRGGSRAPGGPPQEWGGGRAAWPAEHQVPHQADVAARDAVQRDPTSTGEVPRTKSRAARSAASGGAGRSLAGIAIVLVAGVLTLPILAVLVDSVVGRPLSASGVVASVLVLLGLPVGAIGFYGLATGAARSSSGPPPYAVWLRPPLAYIPIALVLFTAAGLAAR